MSKRKKPVPPPTAPLPPVERRSAEDRRRRFGWEGDDVLHLKVDGADVQSTPKKDDE